MSSRYIAGRTDCSLVGTRKCYLPKITQLTCCGVNVDLICPEIKFISFVGRLAFRVTTVRCYPELYNISPETALLMTRHDQCVLVMFSRSICHQDSSYRHS